MVVGRPPSPVAESYRGRPWCAPRNGLRGVAGGLLLTAGRLLRRASFASPLVGTLTGQALNVLTDGSWLGSVATFKPHAASPVFAPCHYRATSTCIPWVLPVCCGHARLV